MLAAREKEVHRKESDAAKETSEKERNEKDAGRFHFPRGGPIDWVGWAVVPPLTSGYVLLGAALRGGATRCQAESGPMPASASGVCQSVLIRTLPALALVVGTTTLPSCRLSSASWHKTEPGQGPDRPGCSSL